MAQLTQTSYAFHAALHDVLVQNTGYPFVEFHTALGLHALTHRDDDVEVVILKIAFYQVVFFLLSCRKFCDSWKRSIGKFFSKSV